MADQVPGDSTVYGPNAQGNQDGHSMSDSAYPHSSEPPSPEPPALNLLSPNSQSPTDTGQLPLARLADGRFEIHETLGRGGFATVHRAYDQHLQRMVALKLPHGHVLGNRSAQQWLSREARATAALSHDSIVRLFDYRIDQQARYLVSELIEGQTLAEYIKSNPHGVPAAQAVDIVLPIALALEHAHSKGVVHRDVKPSNILLDHRQPTDSLHGSPRLADFGLASAPTQDTLTATGQHLMGSIHYLPPELITSSYQDLPSVSDIEFSMNADSLQPAVPADPDGTIPPGAQVTSNSGSVPVAFTAQGDVYALSHYCSARDLR